MTKKLLFTALGLAALTASAQLNGAGDGYTLNLLSPSSQCLINSGLPNHGGLMNVDGASIASNELTANGWEFTGASTVGSGNATWMSIPEITATCSSLWAEGSGIDMSSNASVTVTASAPSGSTLEVYIGEDGQWGPNSSTYNTGTGSIIASHTFTGTTAETFTFDMSALEATVWSGWTAKNDVKCVGFRAGTANAVFIVTEIKFGADADASTGGETCSDGIMNQDETGVDCGGSSCSACGGGGGNGVACIVTTDDGQAEATFYNLIANGTSTTVRCTFNVTDYVKGTNYGALELATLQETPAKYCGMCAEVTGPLGTATVQIVDECPDCWEHNIGDTDIDLSPTAFNTIVGASSVGRADITWSEVSCPWTTPISLIYESAHEWNVKVIIQNHVNRIASVEITQGGVYQHMTRDAGNGWTGASLSGQSKDIRITDIYGSVIEMTNQDFSSTIAWVTVVGTEQFDACGLGTSTNRVDALDYVTVYPNPANASVTFAGLEGATEIQVISTVGAVVATQALNGAANEVSLDVSGLKSGLYIAKISNGSGVYTKTFVKQ